MNLKRNTGILIIPIFILNISIVYPNDDQIREKEIKIIVDSMKRCGHEKEESQDISTDGKLKKTASESISIFQIGNEEFKFKKTFNKQVTIDNHSDYRYSHEYNSAAHFKNLNIDVEVESHKVKLQCVDNNCFETSEEKQELNINGPREKLSEYVKESNKGSETFEFCNEDAAERVAEAFKYLIKHK